MGTMADLFKPKPAPKPAAVAPKAVPAAPKPAAPAVAAARAAPVAPAAAAPAPTGVWGEKRPDAQAVPAAPQTGLATSLMSALGAGKQPAQSSIPQQTQPSAGQGHIAESAQRAQQPGASSAEGVGLDLQFGNFGLGAANDFGSGFGAPFDSQQAPAAQAPATARYNESASSGQDKANTFSSFQQNGPSAVQMNNVDPQPHMQHQGYGGYSGYQQQAQYWAQQPQQPPSRPVQPQQQPQQPQQPNEKKAAGSTMHSQQQQQEQQQQQMHQAQYGGYVAPSMQHQYPQYGGYGQYAAQNYYQYYPQQAYPYYPQQAPQYPAPPQPPSTGQPQRGGQPQGNFGGLYDQGAENNNYGQAPNYQGQHAYAGYGGQYAR